MKEKNLHKFNPETGKLKVLEKNFKASGRAETVVKTFFEEKGWKVLNVSPKMGIDSIPDKLNGLEKVIEKGVPDLFLYGRIDKNNKFVEVKDAGDGIRFGQLSFMKSINIDCSVIFVESASKEFECSDCGKIFDSERGLKGHKSSCYTEPEESPVKIHRVSRFGENRSSRGGSE